MTAFFWPSLCQSWTEQNCFIWLHFKSNAPMVCKMWLMLKLRRLFIKIGQYYINHALLNYRTNPRRYPVGVFRRFSYFCHISSIRHVLGVLTWALGQPFIMTELMLGSWPIQKILVPVKLSTVVVVFSLGLVRRLQITLLQEPRTFHYIEQMSGKKLYKSSQ